MFVMLRGVSRFCLISVCAVIVLLASCSESKKDSIRHVIGEWEGKELVFPEHPVFTIQGKDTVFPEGNKAQYKVLSYVDTIGCTSCKIQLPNWKKLISEFDSVFQGKVDFLFYLHPKSRKEIVYLLKRDNFIFPVCIDDHDSLNILNHFPQDDMFHTFLLDKGNHIVAIGNPVRNPRIKELFLKIISGGRQQHHSDTTQAVVNVSDIDFGVIKRGKNYSKTVNVRNIGNNPLIISDVSASCDCVKVKVPQDPIPPNKSAEIVVCYRSDYSVDFEETIRFKSNSYPELPDIKLFGEVEH